MRMSRVSPWLAAFAFVAVVLVLRRSSFDARDWVMSTRIRDVRMQSPLKGGGYPPVFAYWISGTGGENRKILRLLRAVYHPRNRYLVHLDAGATAAERAELARLIRAEKVFGAFGNVDVVGASYAVDRSGSSVLAAALHGAAVLLKIGEGWDWFVALSSWDYPIVTQDDLLYAFTSVPRDLNFIDHISDLGWKEHERFEKLIVDPSLYMAKNTKPFLATETRPMPDAFKIFTGSPWVILSRNFTEHCVHSWDNLPRKLLMYFANVAYSMESYFQTVICSSPKFRNTTVNGDLRYFVWDDPPGLDSLPLNESHFQAMVNSTAAFARRFDEDTPVLRKVDEEILSRPSGQVVYGKWCSNFDEEQRGMDLDRCSKWGDINIVQPRPLGKKLRHSISEMIQTRGCS